MRRLTLTILSITSLIAVAPFVCVADSGRHGLLSTTKDPFLVPDELIDIVTLI